jgi:hypothetical protein
MCYAKPGPRCAPHAAEKRQKSLVRLYEALPESYKARVDPELKTDEINLAKLRKEVVSSAGYEHDFRREFGERAGQKNEQLRSLGESLRLGSISEDEVIGAIKTLELSFDTTPYENAAPARPIDHVASFASRVFKKEESNREKLAKAISAKAVDDGFAIMDQRFAYDRKAENNPQLAMDAASVRELKREIKNKEITLARRKEKVAEIASKDLSLSGDTKISTLSEAYREAKKEHQLTPGYRNNARSAAEYATRMGEPGAAKLTQRSQNLDKEFGAKYAGWLESREGKQYSRAKDKARLSEVISSDYENFKSSFDNIK